MSVIEGHREFMHIFYAHIHTYILLASEDMFVQHSYKLLAAFWEQETVLFSCMQPTRAGDVSVQVFW